MRITESEKKINPTNDLVMRRDTFLFSTMALLGTRFFRKLKSLQTGRAIKGFKVNAGEARFGRHYKMKGVTLNNLDIKISGSDTADDLAVFEQTGLTQNGGPPLHIHLFQDEWFYVIEGNYLFQVGDDRYSMSPGDTIFLPRTVPHAFVQLSDRGKMIVSYLPAGKMEAFFKITDQWETPPTQAEIARVFEAHDMKIVGKPLNPS